ncbi:hypothetical protein [Modestobacter versicolor]|uniref:hypothetical protein n=1 Tax=Modestobacter versicolor TaxID=429133 RepID=UPI0034DFF3F0
MTDDVDLQRRLTGLAERSAPPPRADLADVVVARHRARHRQALGAAGLAAAVAALVVASTTLLPGGPAAEPAGAASVDLPAAEPAPEPPGVDVLAGPARGPLAGDAAFLDGVRRLPWADAGTDVPPGSRRVVFAGDVAGGRWALVAGTASGTDDTALAWFSGPPGAPAEQLRPAGVPVVVDPARPVARADNGTGALVVVAAPGDAVELSSRPDVAADGTSSRAWQPVDAPDGVVVTTLPPGAAPYATAVRYRVVRDGVEVATAVPDGHSSTAAAPAPAAVEWVRPQPPPAAGDAAVAGAVAEVLGATGLTPAEVTVAALWAGDVPGPHDRPARVTLLAVTLPSGAVYLTAPFGYGTADGSVLGGSCGSGVQAAGVAPADQALVVRCDVPDGTADAATTSSLVVLAPQAATAQAVDMTGVALTAFPLVDGVAVVDAPERTASVAASADDGRSWRLRLLATADLG